MSEFKNYYNKVQEEAKDFVNECIKELCLDIEEDGANDIYDFVNDHRLHEWVDNNFIYVDLIDSAYILKESDNVETDCGLWEGLEPIKAVESQAFFTYKNDMNEEIMKLIKEKLEERLVNHKINLEELNDGAEVDDEDLDSVVIELEDKMNYLEEAINNM